MAFISSSVTNITKVAAAPSELTKIQSGFTGGVSEISSQAATAVSGTVLGPVNATGTKLSGSLGSISGGIQGINGTVGGITSTVGGLAKSLGSVNTYLNSAVKSITSTFDGAVKSLASGLDSRLGSLFGNTTVKSAASVTSLISDPVKTNLIDTKPPTSSSWKISSLEAGSQTISMAGVSSQFGSNAGSMIGTNLSTILNRFNLDSPTSIANGIVKSNSNNSLKSLFSSVSTIAKTASTAVASAKQVVNTATAISQIPEQVANAAAKSLTNDIQSFLNRSSSLQNATGIEASDFFISNDKVSLLDASGTAVDTNGVKADATTANSLLEIARLIGCSSDITSYSSADEIGSLYNYILSLASAQGISSLVESLLGCQYADGVLGQAAVTNAFTSTVGKSLGIASLLLNVVENKAALNTSEVTDSIVTNINLTASDVTLVNGIMVNLGTTTQKAYTIPGISSDDVPVYSSDLLVGSQKSFVDGVFQDAVFTTYTNGEVMSLQPDGTMWV